MDWAEARKEKVERRIDLGKEEGRRKEMALWGSLWRNLNGLNGWRHCSEREREWLNTHGTFPSFGPFTCDVSSEYSEPIRVRSSVVDHPRMAVKFGSGERGKVILVNHPERWEMSAKCRERNAELRKPQSIIAKKLFLLGFHRHSIKLQNIHP